MTDSWASSPGNRRSMQGNRSRDTKPEVRLRQALHARGLRYRVCARPLPDVRRTADIVFTRKKVAVQMHGCFWHACPEHFRWPKTNAGYWRPKIERNVARDVDLQRLLAENGWQLVVVWEHEALDDAVDRISRAIADASS